MSVCDHIYVFDQASDDGSLDYYKTIENCTVIESPTNRFSEEVVCKQELLERIQKDHPDADWIFWLDGDTLMDGRLLKDERVRTLLVKMGTQGYDGLRLGHYNL